MVAVACRASEIAMALFGGLVLVSLLRNAEVDGAAPAYIIGYNLSKGLKGGFIVFSAALGALGSFFSGSTTVSQPNLWHRSAGTWGDNSRNKYWFQLSPALTSSHLQRNSLEGLCT
jgi:hypothetical protein